MHRPVLHRPALTRIRQVCSSPRARAVVGVLALLAVTTFAPDHDGAVAQPTADGEDDGAGRNVTAASPAPRRTGDGAQDGPAPPVGTRDSHPEVQHVLGLLPTASTSRGGPSAGSLEGGVPFPLQAEGAHFNPRRDARARYGTVELVQALLRAGAAVHARHGGELVVNDLSLISGGPIAHHGSHQGGRDVDVLFYTLTAEGEPRPSVGAPLDLAGRGVDFQDLSVAADDVPVQLDVVRTWAFVEALLSDPDAWVQRMFVARHLRQRLLRHGRRAGASRAVLRRFEQVACQPGYPHDDHFHIRVFCSVDDLAAGCRDSGPMPPWHRARLASAGATPRMAGPERLRAPITTAAEARRAAGPMHPDVRAWLDARDAWMRPPAGPGVCR
ncbi:MAG: penicillin-insensitive murein endopeptidase [Sandaracinaceae bacterium]|nr:penicillin-insensitive murein endopeptidase [Sandaracinaceae bacterium]